MKRPQTLEIPKKTEFTALLNTETTQTAHLTYETYITQTLSPK